MLTVIAVWTDTGRTDGWTDGRTDAKVVLYSVQCCTLHWTDKLCYPSKKVRFIDAGASIPNANEANSHSPPLFSFPSLPFAPSFPSQYPYFFFPSLSSLFILPYPFPYREAAP